MESGLQQNIIDSLNELEKDDKTIYLMFLWGDNIPDFKSLSKEPLANKNGKDIKTSVVYTLT